MVDKTLSRAELNAMPKYIYYRPSETDVIPVEPCTNTWINGGIVSLLLIV